MATTTREAPSTGFETLQTTWRRMPPRLELWLETQRGQLPLWLPVFLGLGIAMWFLLPTRLEWAAMIVGGLCVAIIGLVIGAGKRTGFALIIAGVMTSTGCSLVWIRAASIDSQPLARPQIFTLTGRIDRVERLAARDQVRLRITTEAQEGLPPKIRVSMPADALIGQAPLVQNMRIRLRARLMPPTDATVPGGYDFARTAWFIGLGATGKLLGPIERLKGEGLDGTDDREAERPLRTVLADHVAAQSSAKSAGIAIALVTGEQGRVSKEDQDAMRASGLAHLLSISGLHITAVVGAAMLLSLRLLALSPRLALNFPLPVVAAGVGALAGIAYTLISGAEVPTVRSCIAAILVLIGLAMGREALTLRLVGVGALFVLFLWPESLVGPSFQLSFAAITALVALHELAWVKRITEKRDERRVWKLARFALSLLLTGLAVEIALMPIALFHFHKSGLYGAIANIFAIPMTTFIIMPLEAGALILDIIGLGAPLWWCVDAAIGALLWIAHRVAALPGAMAMIPSVPVMAFAAMLCGGLWLLLWRGPVRLWGLIPFGVSSAAALSLAPPDLLITGDGRHMAIRTPEGRLATLRSRAGDYVRDTLAERGGAEAMDDLDNMPGTRCSDDSCFVEMPRSGRMWRILATRSRHLSAWRDMVDACAVSDIVISDRKLPQACKPRWFKADRLLLEKTGGLAISLSPPALETVLSGQDEHPWRVKGTH